MCRQTAGCSAGTARAYGQQGLRPQGFVAAAARRPRHGRPNNRGRCRQTAGSNAGTAKAYSRAWWKLPRRIWSILGVLRVWSLASGRHGRLNNRGQWRQTAGKRQADRSCRGAGKLSQPRKTSSTPAVVPGAAPALGKAGVGGFFLNSKNSHCPKERKNLDPVIVRLPSGSQTWLAGKISCLVRWFYHLKSFAKSCKWF